MARFVLFLILLVPMAVAGNWLMAHPGEVNIDWLGYTITLHTALAVLILAVACLFVVLLALALWQLVTWPERRRAHKRHRQLARGLREITHGMTSLALGHEGAAEAALKKARQLLPGEPLPQLLTAQLLQRQGKHDAARGHFRALLAHESTAQLATQRLIEQHLARREWAEAAALAEEARRDAPSDRWLALTLIDLYTRLGASAPIKALTEGWHWHSPLSREERHRYAALAYFMAAREESTPRGRITALRHAYGYAPAFLPAAIAYAEQLLADSQPKAARKVLLHAWEVQPASLLIAPIIAAMGNATPRQQERLLRPFIKTGSGATHALLEAYQALEAGDYPRARTRAEAALAQEESKQACAIIAEVEKHLHGPEAAAVWLARAMDAPAGAAWICHRCGTAHALWQAHCQGCDAFDTLQFERPEARITSVELPARVS